MHQAVRNRLCKMVIFYLEQQDQCYNGIALFLLSMINKYVVQDSVCCVLAHQLYIHTGYIIAYLQQISIIMLNYINKAQVILQLAMRN